MTELTEDQKRIKALLPVIQAYAEGKTIQIKPTFGGWEDLLGPVVRFDGGANEYRIKPEPREWWICENCQRIYIASTEPAYTLNHEKTNCGFFVHVREVLEGEKP